MKAGGHKRRQIVPLRRGDQDERRRHRGAAGRKGAPQARDRGAIDQEALQPDRGEQPSRCGGLRAARRPGCGAPGVSCRASSGASIVPAATISTFDAGEIGRREPRRVSPGRPAGQRER